ncbi:PREDICTED: serine/threonine-protein kinase-like protein CCR4 isoform X2 [Tarenaya hassleriana]|uniref:serine/threonine-protein kinase-like protein CCR4 isoform X2 n=1 Tax=Tarenaya hassleriana TaxID=28532 RepID=UPI00053C2308|nr:PREDICTED: serine/threonine-protein kinase-like protein CCR4 isoform X2 [Tarenaya hassleriana]
MHLETRFSLRVSSRTSKWKTEFQDTEVFPWSSSCLEMRSFFRWQQLLLLTLGQVSSSTQISFVPENGMTRDISCKLGELNTVSLQRRGESPVIEGNDVPTLTPIQETDAEKPRKQRFAAVIGGIGAAFLVFLIVGFIYIYLMCVGRRRFLRQTTSETVSSPLPSPREMQEKIKISSCGSTQNLRKITLPELDQATNYFNQNNMMGEGLFGSVYKGLLQDGSIVAVKRRIHNQNQSFVRELNRLAQVQHKNLVKICGYYEDTHQQILISDYIHNGDVGRYLYDSDGIPNGRLNIQQRLLIALDAAKGLEHLHGLDPPLVHMHFRTRNVLLDENFTAKVSDYGISRLVCEDSHQAGPSSTSTDSFIDPLFAISPLSPLKSQTLQNPELKSIFPHCFSVS